MSVAPINDHEKPEHPSPADGAVDGRFIAQMEKLCEQGFSFRDIAAVLMRQGLMLSPDRVKEILDVCQAGRPKK
jgi:hypothetical protein